MTEFVGLGYMPLEKPIRITEQDWPKGTVPIVTTRTMTFMHENYIRECIEGILMQKTTFPVQVLIHDDASTDRTAEIVREYERKYPGVITAFYQTENSYSKPDKHERRKVFFDLIQGKYIALCEGDDYWTDPLKLQKQVEFLEANPDYGLVHTDHSILNSKTGEVHYSKAIFLSMNPESGYVYNEIMMRNSIMLLTVVYRACMSDNLDMGQEHGLVKNDYFLWLHIAYSSKIKYMDDVTAMYRNLQGSISHPSTLAGRLSFNNNVNLIKMHYISKYGCSDQVAEKVLKEYLLTRLRYSVYSPEYNLLQQELAVVAPETRRDSIILLCTRFKCLWVLRLLSRLKLSMRSFVRIAK